MLIAATTAAEEVVMILFMEHIDSGGVENGSIVIALTGAFLIIL